MTKKEFIKAMAAKAGLTNKQTDGVLKAFIEVVTEALQAKDKITLAGFGIFEATKRAARIGHNPKTGNELKIAAATMPKFRPSKVFKDVIDGKQKSANTSAAKNVKSAKAGTAKKKSK